MALQAKLIDEALQLPSRDRAEMARRLLLSLEDPTESDVDDGAWEAEIERRLEAVDNGDFEASDWREAVQRVRNAISGDGTSEKSR